MKSLVMRSNKENLMVEPILQVSEELGTVVQFLSDNTSNPYYMLISPFKKLEFYLWRKEMQAELELNSHCLEENLLNKYSFLYKLKTLISFIECYDRKFSDLPPLALISLFALMKAVRINRKDIYEIMCESEILLEAEKKGLELANKREEERRMPKSIFLLEEPKEKEEKVDKGNMKISFAKSAMATAVLILSCLSFSTT